MAERRRNGKLEARTPEPWASALIEAGFTMPHTTEPVANQAALAGAVGVSLAAIHKIISGETKRPRTETLIAIAEALGQPEATVAEWVNLPWGDDESEWSLPAEARLLSHSERKAVDELILAIARTKVADRRAPAAKEVTAGARPVKSRRAQKA